MLFKHSRNFMTFCREKTLQDSCVRRALLQDDPSRLHPISLKCCKLAIPIGVFLRHADDIYSLFPKIEKLAVFRDVFNGGTSPGPIALQGNIELVNVKDWEKSERLNKTPGYHAKAVKQTTRAKEIFPLFINTHPKHPETFILNALRDKRQIMFRGRAFYESLNEESSFNANLEHLKAPEPDYC